ncbi:MAG: DMT family transporter [Anaerolineaceae bacterium]|nr:DMT family transporter [Anaerolineaceae bacterium]
MTNHTKKSSSTIKGISFLLLALLIMSLQGIIVKEIGGDYPILEIVIFRSFIALPVSLLIFRMEGNRGLPKTKRVGLHSMRGLFLFLSYTTAFMGIAALPLADFSAIRNSGPLMITFLSVIFLAEKVDYKKWIVLIIGFVGVLLIVQPGSATFNIGSIFVLISTLLYALVVLITRKLQTTDSSAAMAYFSTLVYMVAAAIFAPLTIMVGENAGMHPSIAFLFHPWSMPTFVDWLIMSSLGLIWASGMYFIARAYSLAKVSVVAPFEYVGLLINILWDVLLWQIFPTPVMLVGAAFTIISGLYILYRDQRPAPIVNSGIPAPVQKGIGD